ncbi:MAG: Phenylserine dehydratase [Bryobacteraceae bacterium]|nr:Phenylserine dehydratase [Bryobacteraceae bacterium]
MHDGEVERITRGRILEAAERIRPYVRRTPVMALTEGELGVDAEVVLKLELLQHTGSFKPRGAFCRMLAAEVPAAGVTAASGGNHGLAVAYAAANLGHRAEIFLPSLSPAFKVAKVRSYGAEAHVVGRHYLEALAACEARARETGAMAVHAYNQEETLAGQGTVGVEIGEQVPGVDTVLVATGGGGLIGGIAAWFRGEVKVVSVEPVGCASLAAAFEKGERVAVEVGGLAADSLGAAMVGELMFPIARKYVSGAVVVEEEEIREAQRVLWRDFGIVAEPGGATALAALLSRRYKPAKGERVVVVVCGGNTEPGTVV